MNVRIDAWLLPGQRPHDWAGSTPIDLLPLLRQVYPQCIDERLLALQLVNVAWPLRASWCFRVVSAEGEEQVDVAPVTQHQGDGYDFGDMPPDLFPHELIETLCEPDRLAAWQATIRLFRPEAFAMLQRVHDIARDDAAERSVRPYAGRQAFLREVAALLASHLAQSVDLLPAVVSAVKVSEPWGLRGDECGSLWAELGAEAAAPSLLHQRHLDDLSHRVWSEFCALPRAKQVAVWFHARAAEDFPPGRDAEAWEAPGESIETMLLSGMDAYCRRMAANVMRQAEDAHHRACEGG